MRLHATESIIQNNMACKLFRYVLFMCSFLALPFMSCLQSRAQDNLKNRPELRLPLADTKRVIAHCMTNIIRYKGHTFEDSCNPDYFAATGNISSSLGGLTQVRVMSDSLLSNATLDEAVEFEMRTALKCGIDGFQFYYVLGSAAWDEIIKAYFRVADEKNIDFKFTFCISHPAGGTEAGRIAEFAIRMNNIFAAAGHDNPHWLRTPDGRLIVYMWYGDGLADIPDDLKGFSKPYYVASAYNKLGSLVNERLACIFSVNEHISAGTLDEYLDYFPAPWIWTLAYTKNYIGYAIARACKKRNRSFTGSAFPDFYTSKLLKKGTWEMYASAKDAVRAGIKKVERKYLATGLSVNFRSLLQFCIDEDVPIINIITWNDYPEGHHLAPESNHNFGFAELLKYYKSAWKQQSSPYAGKDLAIVFYKKYRHDIVPAPYNIRLVPIATGSVAQADEDIIEVVTFLKEKAQLVVNGNIAAVPAGFFVSSFPQRAGLVNVKVIRDATPVISFSCPEWITDKPYRTDRLTYSFSNGFDEAYKEIFHVLPTQYLNEYSPAALNKNNNEAANGSYNP
jgi:hypothetical protein